MAERRKQIFVSYARDDQDKVQSLITTFRRLPYDVWMDTQLTGGQEWWDTILSQMRASDAVLFVVSNSGLESEACTRELSYARLVNRPILPLRIEPVAAESLPRGIGVLQVVDYTTGHQDELLNLINALMQLPPAGALPDPLPTPPDVPASYLWDIAEQLQQSSLTRDQQLTIVATLRAGLDRVNRPREREAVLELVQRMRNRDDIFFVTAQQLDAMLASAKADKSATAQPAPPKPPEAQPQTQAQSTPPASPPPLRPTPPPPPPQQPTPPQPPRYYEQPLQAPAQSGLNGIEIATIVLLLVCVPAGLVTIWFTRWQMWVKLLIVGGLVALYLIVIFAAIAANSTSSTPTG